MDTKKTCAERMRPILQAMERSIDAARSRRTNEPTSTAVTRPAEPVRRSECSVGTASSTTHVFDEYRDEDGTPRLKARPKRMDAPNSVNPFPDTGYRSQAG